MNSVSPNISASIIIHFSAPPGRGGPLGAVVAALYNNYLDSGDTIFPAIAIEIAMEIANGMAIEIAIEISIEITAKTEIVSETISKLLSK